jgi:Xaa-Pro dipeptidase
MSNMLLELPSPIPPQGEIEGRLQRLRSRMSQSDLELVVLTGQNNIEYFSNHRSLSWTSNSRPMFFLVGLEEAILVASTAEERNYQSQKRPFRAAFYHGFLPDAVPVVLAEARKLSRSAPSVGIDYGVDMFGRGTLALLRAIERGLNRGLCEASELIWSVRMIKSRFEADMKKAAFRIANGAFDAALSEARIGMTEAELFRSIQSRIVLSGAERCDPFPVVFSSGEFVYNRWPSDRKLAAGDYIWTDFRSTFAGYPADRNRIAKAGNAEPWEETCYERVRRLTLELVNGIRPGMTGGGIHALFKDLWAAADLGPVYSRAARIGHGGGMDLTEPPSIMAESEEVIQEGMILHVEPKLEINGAIFQFEEVVYVTKEHNEFLAELCPERLPIVRRA